MPASRRGTDGTFRRRMFDRTGVTIGVRQLASSLAIVGFMFVVFYLWNQYDWNYPDLKVIGYIAALGLVYYVVREGVGRRPSAITTRVEALALGLVLALSL